MEAEIQNIRKFLLMKFPQDFTVIWQQMLLYRAKTGIFTSKELWEDAKLVDAITWWKCFGSKTKHLQEVALAVLNIPTSSAASERCWSAMGNVHTTTRNRLTDERVDKLVYCYFNERMLSEQ